MPFDGSGIFRTLPPPTFPAVVGTLIKADYFNSTINDIATGLTAVNTLANDTIDDLVAGLYADTVVYTPAGGIIDDAPLLGALIAANQGKRVLVHRGSVLNFYTPLAIQVDGVVLDLNNSTTIHHTSNTDSIVVSPPTAGTTSAFLNNFALMNANISHSAVAGTSTSGFGVKLVQCNGVVIQNVVTNNCDNAQFGGQLTRWDGCKFFASSGAARGSGSALLHIQEAPYGGGSFQQPLTTTISNWFASASKLRDCLFRVHAGDGINITNGYGANGLNAIILYFSDRDGSSISSCTLQGNYLDCVNSATGTFSSVELRADSHTASSINGLTINGCWMGNGQLVGILVRKPETINLTITDNIIVNMKTWAVDLAGGTTLSANVSDNQFSGNGTNLSSGDVRFGGGESFTYIGNKHRASHNLCVLISGTWTTGLWSGNTNSTSTCPDIDYSGATFSTDYAYVGNLSTYTTASQSWKGIRITLPNFANDAAAAAGSIPIGGQYRNGSIVQYRVT